MDLEDGPFLGVITFTPFPKDDFYSTDCPLVTVHSLYIFITHISSVDHFSSTPFPYPSVFQSLILTVPDLSFS